MADTLVECVVCHRSVEQILLLECNHNPCIGCASSLTNHGEKQHYECPTCGSSTKLEPSTVQQLKRLASAKPTHNKSLSSLQGNFKRLIRLANHTATKSSLPQIDDEAFCFQCWRVLSLEDMMLDAHRNHDVKMLSKSFTKLKHMLSEREQCLRKKHNELRQLSAFSERTKRECEQLIEAKKKEVLSVYAKAIKQAQQAREQALQAITCHFKRYLKATETQVGEYHKKEGEAALLQSALEEIDNKLSSGNKTAFDDFSQLGVRLKQLENYQQRAMPEAPSMGCFEVDTAAADRLIRTLGSIQLFARREVDSLFKGSSSTKHLRIKTEHGDDPDCSFFSRLRTKVFSNTNQEHLSRLRQGRKTPSNDKNRHQLSCLSEAKPNSQPLQISKLQLKKQLASSVTTSAANKQLSSSAAQRSSNKENLYRIIL